MSSGGLEPIALRPVDAVAVTTLVDNVTDSLLPDQGPSARPSTTTAPRIATRLHIGGDTDDALRAEHGFSALVTVKNAGRETRVLFDPLQGAGFEIVEQRQPSFLLDGSLLVTGEVDRSTAFERGFPGHEVHRHGGWEPDPLILDDQALVASVRGHGLVVLTGCGHSGIINILRCVRKLTGEAWIHAVLKGFRLSGKAFEPIIGPTCDALGAFSPDVLVPAHCTTAAAPQEARP